MLLKSETKMIIGYDLANACSQISYGYVQTAGLFGKSDISDHVETVPAVEGEENFDIPTVLCKRIGTNQWLFGRMALRFAAEQPEESILIENLLQLALEGEILQIDGRGYHPATLLTLFIRRSLSTVMDGRMPVAAIMFTGQEQEAVMQPLIQRISKALDLKDTHICYQSYEESFFHYLNHQKSYDTALLLDYRGEELETVLLAENGQTVPKVIYSRKRSFRFAGTDRELLDIAGQLCEGQRIDTVYLIGEKFGGDWMDQSLQYLCAGRRVFQGNNLYSKGACYSLLAESDREERLFLGPDKLKANVGMRIRKRGEAAYSALLDAGMYWQKMEEIAEFYLRGENVLELEVIPVVQSPARHVTIHLDGLQLQRGETTRVRLHLTMPEERLLHVLVTDLGFGDFRQACDSRWEQTVELYD